MKKIKTADKGAKKSAVRTPKRAKHFPFEDLDKLQRRVEDRGASTIDLMIGSLKRS